MTEFELISAEQASRLFCKPHSASGAKSRVSAETIAAAIEAGHLRGRKISNTYWTTVADLNAWGRGLPRERSND